jgi:hypothetical protein
MFMRPPHLTVGWFAAADTDVSCDLPEPERQYLPDWLSDEVASRIYRTINMWRYANLSRDDLIIHIPADWVPNRDEHRHYEEGCQMFGLPLRLIERLQEPIVSVIVKERP